MTKPLRWGILGAASIGEKVIPAIARCPGSTLVAIASRRLDKARDWAARYGIAQAFGSYDALIDSGAVDLIYLPLPNSLHAEWTIRALRAGLHVLCEKPLTVNTDEARQVAAVAQETGRLVMEAFMYRHHPIYAALAGQIRAGAIGRVVTLHSEFSFMLDEADSIVSDAALGGGSLLDVGCYCVNASRLLLGGEPLRVSAFARLDGVDHTMCGMMEFPGGVVATFTSSIERAERHRVEVQGETGHLVLEAPWHPRESGERILLERHGEPVRVIPVAGANPYDLEVRDFVEACAGRAPLRWGLDDAIANLAVLDALARSAREGGPVRLG